MDLATYTALGLDHSLMESDITQPVNGRTFFEDVTTSNSAEGDAGYEPSPEAFPGDAVPRGAVEHIPAWPSDTSYPGTTRAVWIYTSPGSRDGADAPALIVFNDGGMYVDEGGAVRATAVLDSLVHAGELGPVVAVFANPGVPGGAEPGFGDLDTFRHRSVEYDTCNAAFASFLETELLPMAEARVGRPFTRDPARRMIAGISSGGICAFNTAWHRPDLFGLVLSHCGSFTAIRGGHNYPYLVRSSERKPIRAFLQSGAADLDTLFGNWALANQAMAAALDYASYEFRFEFGTGGHSLAHAGACFADAVRWLLPDG